VEFQYQHSRTSKKRDRRSGLSLVLMLPDALA
jgi:hypothetical protein